MRRAAAVVLATLALLPAPGAQGDGPPDSGGHADVPDVVDVLAGDTAQAGVKEFGDACRGNAREMEGLRQAVSVRAAQRGLDRAKAARGQALEKEGQRAAASAGRLADWAKKAGAVMKTIDIVGPVARAAGHYYEGDRAGAMSELVGEGLKKVAVAAGTTAGSVVPGGSIVGAAAAEEFHEAFVRPQMERTADRAREKEARERLLGPRGQPNAPSEQVMGPDGHVKTLPRDMEVDRGTGNVRQRSPEEQAAHEREWREDRRRAAESIHPLDEAAKDLREGRISEEEFDRRVAEFNKEHPQTPADDEGEGEPEEDEPAEVAGPRDILSLVKPVQVTAVGATEDDMSSGEFTNIVTTTFGLRFWNVGSLAPGYETATMAITSTASLGGAQQRSSCRGTFSGGPSGSFRMVCDGDVRAFSLQGGHTVDMGGVTGVVDNPGAFAGWPAGY